jgi:hypothetical protein
MASLTDKFMFAFLTNNNACIDHLDIILKHVTSKQYILNFECVVE